MHGKIIRLYKFRTMYPYAEYLQEYVYDRHKLEDGGKFKNDFRVHPLGHWMRFLHIDELPQFVNLFRGDLGFIGVRALSEHYFRLYPKELQDKRIQFKPGCIPPYYADMPKSFEEILESERRYLAQKEKHSFLTDVRYFFRAMKNLFVEIIIKPGRSKNRMQECRFDDRKI
jgi:lipopolysaccharide/colanic/teichoic acid biosynthesis glycosyltransferase